MPLLQNCINTPNPGMMHAKRLTCSPFIDSFDSLKVSWITAFAHTPALLMIVTQ